jgi:hypothetical protein
MGPGAEITAGVCPTPRRGIVKPRDNPGLNRSGFKLCRGHLLVIANDANAAG